MKKSPTFLCLLVCCTLITSFTVIPSIKIISYKYELCLDCSSSKDTLECKRWKRANLQTIELVANKMTPSHGMDIHDNYATLTCVINGKCVFKKDTCDFEINAGGYMYIQQKDASLIYVMDRKNPLFKSFFNIKVAGY